MERLRWQRSKLAAQHAPFLKLEVKTFVRVLLLIFLINQFCKPKPHSKNTDGIRYKVPVMYEMIGVWL